MSKQQYIRRRVSLTVGGGSKFECKSCIKQFSSKPEFKQHWGVVHKNNAKN